MPAYYNENEPYAAEWLRALVARELIAPGEVDDRSIEDVTPAEVAHRTQAHFFAGIGIWSHALRLAGWPDHVPVWTGSAPCQPFSQAGAKRGALDSRHLWPTWFALIRECGPPIVFGEQVASPDGYAWFEHVRNDLESAGYAVGAADFCAASIGAPHIRQRIYFCGVANRDEGRRALFGSPWLHERRQRRNHVDGCGSDGVAPGLVNGHWSNAEWLNCRDGKLRPVEPGTFPLVDGNPSRVGRLRAYGNAIVAPQAAIFIEAVIDSLLDLTK